MYRQWKHKMKNFVTTNTLKQNIESEFMYRAQKGRTSYTMEEIIYIVWKVIDETVWEVTK